MILAIIQARLSSSRLPQKVLLDLFGKSLLGHIIDRVKSSRLVDQVIVATTTSASDDPLVDHLDKNRLCPVFRGSENDVLDRFYQCARVHAPEVIVRITADDPLKDPEIIDRAITLLQGNPALDYCSNTLKPTFPEGLDVEVFRFRALERAHREATLESEHEHVTPYIWKHPERFTTLNFENNEDLSHWRWTVDKPEDFAFMQAIYRHFYRGNSYFSFREVIEYLRSRPELVAINSGTVRNEGYLKSLCQEQESPAKVPASKHSP